MARKTQRPAVPEGIEPNPRFVTQPKRGNRGRPKHSVMNFQRKQRFFKAMEASDDRTLAIMGGNFLDNALALSIMKRLRKLTPHYKRRLFEGESSALGRTYAKIQIAFALKLIDDAGYEQLMTINRIRNLFAHDLHLKRFSDPRVSRLCRKLSCAYSYPWGLWDRGGGPEPRRATARLTYSSAISSMALTMSLLTFRRTWPRQWSAPPRILGTSHFESWHKRLVEQRRPRIRAES